MGKSMSPTSENFVTFEQCQENIKCKGVVKRGKCTNTHDFFFVDLADLPPSPSYHIRYGFPSSDGLLNVFLSYISGFSNILHLHLSLLT